MKKALLVALTLSLFLALLPAEAFCQARVVVFPFKNNGQPQYNGLASGIAAMFITDLARSKDIEVVNPRKVEGALGKARLAGGAPSFEDATRAAEALDANYSVMGEFVVFGGKFRIDVRVYDVKTGALVGADKGQAKEDALFDMADELSDKVIFRITGSIPKVGGGLQVTTDPPGADLRVDGDNKGQTPATLKGLPAGSHKVELSLDGYQAYSADVPVKENETAKVDVKLIRLMGGLRIWWKDLPQSDISIGNDIIPISVFQNVYILSKYCKNLPAGDYKVSVRMPYKEESSWSNTRTWKTYTEDVDISPGVVTDIFIKNDLFSPGIMVSTCGSCAASWDFGTKLYWFEMQ
jgi:TolB-like protein